MRPAKKSPVSTQSFGTRQPTSRTYLGNESFAGIPWTADGYSDVEGVIVWTNVPVGTYYLCIDAYRLTASVRCSDYSTKACGDIEGPFTLNEGEDLVLDNELDRILPMERTSSLALKLPALKSVSTRTTTTTVISMTTK